MTAYATVADVQARWTNHTMTADEQTAAATLLDDAAVVLSTLVDVDPNDAEQSEILKMVSCNMVIRAMSSAVDAYGVSNTSITAGVYSQSFTYAGASGDLYLTKLEKRLLGVTTGYIASIPVQIGGVS